MYHISRASLFFFAVSPCCRLKELKAENDRLEGRASAAERNAASLDAQRKSTMAEKTKLQKRVCLIASKINCLC